MNNKIVTYTGKVFDLLNPKPEMVCIEDIAHSLAYQCRYAGHTRKFYSVAQHCILMADNPDLPGDPLQKLLHDAAETYIGDMAKPWKNLLWATYNPEHRGLCRVGVFENEIQEVIGIALGVDLAYSAEVKESDLRMMATEIRDLMPGFLLGYDWGIGKSEPVKEIIKCWHPEVAERVFLNMYAWLIKENLK